MATSMATMAAAHLAGRLSVDSSCQAGIIFCFAHRSTDSHVAKHLYELGTPGTVWNTDTSKGLGFG
jgi:hypothetical protein